jgi:hypothetical protein
MSDMAGAHLDEEPQAERGPAGSRDTGADEPAGGPADRPAGTAEPDSDSSVQTQGTRDAGAPHLPTGDGGG